MSPLGVPESGRGTRVGVLLGLLTAAGCAVDTPIFAGPSDAAVTDAGAPIDAPDFAMLTVVRTGTAMGTVNSTPPGIDCGGDCTEVYAGGTAVTLVAAPANGVAFAGWSGGGCQGTKPCTLEMTQMRAVFADFARNTLTVTTTGVGQGTISSAPAGIDCGSACSADFNTGTVVTLTAAPTMQSTLTGWSGGGCSGTGSCAVRLDGPIGVTADFALRRYDLLVVKTGSGGGSVFSSPTGIACGSDCTEAYSAGTTVTLTASADIHSTFVGWSGAGCSGTAPCNVTIDQARTVTATFTINTYFLLISRTGTGSGVVTSTPGGINCGATCMATYNAGTQVTLSAFAGGNSAFTGWSGGGCSGFGPCIVTMNAPQSVIANFDTDVRLLTVTKAGAGAGTVTSSPAGINCGAACTAFFAQGATVLLTATATAGSIFAGWSGACTGTATCSVTIANSVAVTATFSN